ncbi:MAG: undecaprenyl/decaprenyl-phosphate alpha-N-acetylglucosaminyl 1-phosphate transferase [Planctomycetes bacterium]|nr:undecaprenyl/decaprenyl-phosphate alpha-N-acetylglucosaminyl 1-phosphate transferase [Planctomycetota bacterium]
MTPGDLALFVTGAALPSLVIAWLATFAMRRLAPSWGLIDRPGHRKVHQDPTPMGGGLAIWLGVIATVALVHLVVVLAQTNPALVPEFARPHIEGFLAKAVSLWILLGAATVMMVLGLVDDFRGLPWQARLGTQAVVAGLCVWRWEELQLSLFIDAPLLTGALSVLWIMALVNSFNMLDNMDGLSAGVAAIGSAMLAAVLLAMPDPQTGSPQLFVAGLLLVIAGSLLGFLWHNRTPARIFMGDAGSYFVGFSMATATLLATFAGYQSPKQHAILAPLCVLAVPLYDMITVLWIRIREGRSPFVGDKSHFSHRLVELGLTKKQAVRTIYLTTATCGLGALLLHQVDLFGAAVILLLVLSILALVAILETAARRKKATREPKKRR